jgi:hypothetical protein
MRVNYARERDRKKKKKERRQSILEAEIMALM